MKIVSLNILCILLWYIIKLWWNSIVSLSLFLKIDKNLFKYFLNFLSISFENILRLIWTKMFDRRGECCKFFLHGCVDDSWIFHSRGIGRQRKLVDFVSENRVNEQLLVMKRVTWRAGKYNLAFIQAEVILHWLPVRHRISFKIAMVTFRVPQFQQPSYLSSLILRYVPARALRSSSSFSICVPPHKTTMATSKLFTSVASNIWNHLSSIPTLPLLEELSNITYFSLLTLTVVQNLVRSNQLNVSHFVIQCQLLPLHHPETPCRPSKGVPSEHLRLVEVINFA